MKKFTTTLAFVTLVGISFTFANPNPEKREFKSTHNDINLEVERTRGEVQLHFLSQYFGELEQIVVERSGESLSGFTPCKVIDLKEQPLVDGNYMISKDRFPYPASVDTYYRIKTISKEGITKTYAPVQLSSMHN